MKWNYQFWISGKKKIFFKHRLKIVKANPEYVFYEGPPTANGMPGVHHVLARVFKDIFPRYKTMRGFHVIAARWVGYAWLAG